MTNTFCDVHITQVRHPTDNDAGFLQAFPPRGGKHVLIEHLRLTAREETMITVPKYRNTSAWREYEHVHLSHFK